MNSPEHTPITSQFYVSLLGFLLTAKHHLIAVGADYGLTGIQAVALLVLDNRTACPMKSLCHIFHCDASNVTGIIDGLENKGLVERRNDPSDRRIKTIAICPAGQQVKELILARMVQDTDFLFGSLSSSETEQFVYVVEKLDPQKKLAL